MCAKTIDCLIVCRALFIGVPHLLACLIDLCAMTLKVVVSRAWCRAPTGRARTDSSARREERYARFLGRVGVLSRPALGGSWYVRFQVGGMCCRALQCDVARCSALQYVVVGF